MDVGTSDLRLAGNRISGTIVSPDDGRVAMFPLSMLSGWRATVNGKPVDCGRAPEGFLSVPLAAGENVVEMACFPKGLLPGLIATAVSLLLLLALEIAYRRGWKEPGWLCRLAGWAYVAALALGILVVYALPGARAVLKLL